MIPHDQLFKDLLQIFFDQLLYLVTPELAPRLDLKSRQFLKDEHFVDIPRGDQRRLDLVVEIPTKTGQPEAVLCHIEAEGEARAAIGQRLWRYTMQLKLRYDRSVVAIVVFRSGGPAGVAQVLLRDRLWGCELGAFHYFAFGLSGCQARTYLERPEPLAWALAALMRPGEWSSAKHKLECLRPITGAALDKAQRFLLINFVETYIQLNPEQAAEYQTLLAEQGNEEVKTMEMTWADEIEARGVQKGLEKGIQQGIKGMQKMVLRLMEKRWDTVPGPIRQRVEAIDSQDTLTELVDQIISVSSWDALKFESGP